jgi:plasmid replication initiation protein
MENKALTVVKSNKVVEASYKLTLMEQRILLACIAKIKSKEVLLEDNCFEISAMEIVDLVGLKHTSTAYEALEEASMQLSKRQIIINDPDPDKPKTRRRVMNWISSIDYQPGEGKVIIRFTHEMIPYLSNLSSNFTQYKLNNVMQFKSTHSIRIYEMLMQWKSRGKLEIEVEWLKNQLQLGDSYLRMINFKTKVINVALSEINQHSNIWVKYTQRKAGRTITHFLFTFGEKEPKKTATAKTNGTKQLIPDFQGHPTYTVDSEAILEEHQQLKAKPETKPKKTLDSDKKAKITGLKRAVTQG